MPDPATDEELAKLAERVRAARLAAGLSIDDAAESSGMSPVTWARVEKAQPVRALTYAAIEKVLGWQSGSVDAVLRGGELTLLEGPATHRASTEQASDVDAAEAQLSDDTAVAVLRVVATVLSSNLPDKMKLRLIAREIDVVADALAGDAGDSGADEHRATG